MNYAKIIDVLPRIQRILAVDRDFSILTLWNTHETRRIPLREKLLALANSPESVFNVLLKFDQFELVKTDGFTLYWDGLISVQETDGTVVKAPLDLDPDMLYALSIPA